MNNSKSRNGISARFLIFPNLIIESKEAVHVYSLQFRLEPMVKFAKAHCSGLKSTSNGEAIGSDKPGLFPASVGYILALLHHEIRFSERSGQKIR
ncbi:MAG TPA: hypothetical protein EYN18_06450 [Nitrospirales bacterium]|nr:hypothetical protein [Nitrospirales bacterium]